MAALTIELLPQKAQTDFNLRRWDELQADRELARFPGRIETDRHGHIMMSPPPAASHGGYQSQVSHLLNQFVRGGRVFTECPISTADGVKAADVAWASSKLVRELGKRACFPQAPEICVEVLSPSNTPLEIDEKAALYFDAGAQEVWICDQSGQLQFRASGGSVPLRRSRLCPEFPVRIEFPED